MFIQTVVDQYPPNPDNGQGWSQTPTISTNAAVPLGCPNSYALNVPFYDMRFNPMTNFFSTRSGVQGFIVEGYAIAQGTATTNLGMFIRYGEVYSNTSPNGYSAAGQSILDRNTYTTWKYFRVYCWGTIPSSGTKKVSVNINASGNGWWLSGLTVRKIV